MMIPPPIKTHNETDDLRVDGNTLRLFARCQIAAR